MKLSNILSYSCIILVPENFVYFLNDIRTVYTYIGSSFIPWYIVTDLNAILWDYCYLSLMNVFIRVALCIVSVCMYACNDDVQWWDVNK